MSADAARIHQLFVHRRDVCALQQESGAYFPAIAPVSVGTVSQHLRGECSVGAYVLNTDDTCRFVMFDLDTYDRMALLCLCDAIERLVADTYAQASQTWSGHPYRCLLLEDSGGKGYHVWLPFSTPRPARDVRAWAQPVVEAYNIGRDRNIPAGAPAIPFTPWPALEVFPKQDALGEGGYGNLVKLPLGVHAKTGARSYFVPRENWASDLRTLAPMPAVLIPAAPAEPERKRTEVAVGDGVAPFTCVARIIVHGAGKGQRDNALYHFARYARASGLPEDIALEWCERVNEGFSPPLTPNEVRTKVRSAYGANTPNPGCSSDWLRDFCPGGAGCFAPWNEERRSRRGSEDEAATDPYPTHLTREERLAWRRQQCQ